MRRGPKDGYLGGAKPHHRRIVWKTISEFCARLELKHSDQQVLLMPSKEGKEIDVAMSYGFRVANMHVVDDNRAIVATLKTRYPEIHTYGVTAGRAVARIAANGFRLTAANFDFCSQVSRAQAVEIESIAASNVFREEGACVAITTLRGREKADVTDFLKGVSPPRAFNAAIVEGALSDRDWQRLSVMGSGLLGETIPDLPRPEIERLYRGALFRCGAYRSTAGSQTMLYGIYGISQEFRMERSKATTRYWACNLARLFRSAA